jgi:hypothetical protein
LRATSFQKLLAAGQIRPYPSKKAAAESQLSLFSQQQPMADLVKCFGKISIYNEHRNKNGASTDPSTTPDLTGINNDLFPLFVQTHWL